MREHRQSSEQAFSLQAQWNGSFDFNQWEQALPGFEAADLSDALYLNEQSFTAESLSQGFPILNHQNDQPAVAHQTTRALQNEAPELRISQTPFNEATPPKSSSTDLHPAKPLYIHIAPAGGLQIARGSNSSPPDRPNRCPYESCNSSLRYPKDLERHKLTHSGERSFKCPVCYCEYYERGFARKDALERHVRKMHRVWLQANRPGEADTRQT